MFSCRYLQASYKEREGLGGDSNCYVFLSMQPLAHSTQKSLSQQPSPKPQAHTPPCLGCVVGPACSVPACFSTLAFSNLMHSYTPQTSWLKHTGGLTAEFITQHTLPSSPSFSLFLTFSSLSFLIPLASLLLFSKIGRPACFTGLFYLTNEMFMWAAKSYLEDFRGCVCECVLCFTIE